MSLSYGEFLGACKCGVGNVDLDPAPDGFPGQQQQTTKAGTTVVSKPVARIPQKRRVDLTSEVEKLEFYASGAPNVDPRVLAQMIVTVRRKLLGSGSWQNASYSDPRSRYDSREDLMRRLEAVERSVGAGVAGPKAYAELAGLGGGLGDLQPPPWGTEINPVTKLASCIRTALCRPQAFCCPGGAVPVPNSCLPGTQLPPQTRIPYPQPHGVPLHPGYGLPLGPTYAVTNPLSPYVTRGSPATVAPGHTGFIPMPGLPSIAAPGVSQEYQIIEPTALSKSLLAKKVAAQTVQKWGAAPVKFIPQSAARIPAKVQQAPAGLKFVQGAGQVRLAPNYLQQAPAVAPTAISAASIMNVASPAQLVQAAPQFQLAQGAGFSQQQQAAAALQASAAASAGLFGLGRRGHGHHKTSCHGVEECLKKIRECKHAANRKRNREGRG